MSVAWYKRPVWGWLFVIKSLLLCPVLFFLVAWTVALVVMPIDPNQGFIDSMIGDAVMGKIWAWMKSWWIVEILATIALTWPMYMMGAAIDKSNARSLARQNVE